MFGRVSAHSIRQGYQTVRNGFYRGYAQGRMIASHLDTGVELLTRTYRAIQPVLKDVAPQYESRATASASALRGDYNSLRARAIDMTDSMTSAHAALKRKVPELGL